MHLDRFERFSRALSLFLSERFVTVPHPLEESCQNDDMPDREPSFKESVRKLAWRHVGLNPQRIRDGGAHVTVAGKHCVTNIGAVQELFTSITRNLFDSIRWTVAIRAFEKLAAPGKRHDSKCGHAETCQKNPRRDSDLPGRGGPS